MITRISARAGNKGKYERCIELRKQGLSYSEIRKEIPVAKSTLQNWLTLAGLTLTTEHLEIQLNKRIENGISGNVGSGAAKLIRENYYKENVNQFLEKHKNNLSPLLIGGCLLYEAEGFKEDCRFSNSDHRVISFSLRFIEPTLKEPAPKE